MQLTQQVENLNPLHLNLFKVNLARSLLQFIARPIKMPLNEQYDIYFLFGENAIVFKTIEYFSFLKK